MLNAEDKIGEYKLVEYIDSGGFGDVWRAVKETEFIETEFALKFFRPKNETFDVERIKKEVKASQKVSGLPHIVSIVEANRFQKYIYIVSEFAEGGSLGKWLEKNEGKAPTHEEAIEITIEILRGLESMHKHGIVHRDLKPDNILIKKGTFCLADFGISREVKTRSKATQTAGTFEFMSPEAFEKNPSVSPQTDIWAVGVILQQLLTGELPFPQKEIPSLITSILMDEPDAMPDNVPKPLRAIVEKALRKDREKRFKTARSMREALRDFLKRTGIDENRLREIERERKRQAELLKLLDEAQIREDELKRQLEEARKKIEENEKNAAPSENEANEKPRDSAEFQPVIRHEGLIRASEFYQDGYRAHVNGNYDEAIKKYNEAIGLDANYAKAYNKRGLAHYKKNNFVQAIKDFNKAIELNPDFADAYNNRGNTHCSKKNYNLAVEDFNKVLELNPKNTYAYKNRAGAYDKMGETDKAQADLQEYLKLTQKRKP